jgi:hypothetical protein
VGAVSLVVRFRRAQLRERLQLRWLALAAAVAAGLLLVALVAGYLGRDPVVLTCLSLGYAGAVLLSGQAFGGIGGQPPSWAVAGLTLAAAALFQPARRRIQQAVDRRFNRRRHDAGRIIEVFGARLRDQVDLQALQGELLAVVDQTMQPTRAWLWLRPPPA